MKKISDNIIFVKDNNDKNDIKECLICYIQNPTNKLCTNCIYLYCEDCSKKINYLCSICGRKKNIFYDDYHFPYNEPMMISYTVSIGLFFGLIFLYVIIMSLFSFYYFINYNRVYHFILIVKSNNLLYTKNIESNISSIIFNDTNKINEINEINNFFELIDYYEIMKMCKK